MAEEVASTPAVPEDAATRKPKGMSVVVMREIRRARRLFRNQETVNEASFVVATANVLALVDLAAAIRESNQVSENGASSS